MENAGDGVLLSADAGMRAYTFFCETCEVLQNIIFKENCWTTDSDFEHRFGRIACFISNNSTNHLGLPKTAFHKRLKVFST